jgi:hypothetical protein
MIDGCMCASIVLESRMMKTDGKIFQVATQQPVKKDALPRLPHERDESRDSQQSDPRSEIRQAFDDIMSGKQDTDLRQTRGVENVVRGQVKRQPK